MFRAKVVHSPVGESVGLTVGSLVDTVGDQEGDTDSKTLFGSSALVYALCSNTHLSDFQL